MNPINPAQLKKLNTLVSKLNIPKDTKADMVEGFSGGRATSSSKLLFDEALQMIAHLQSLAPSAAKAPDPLFKMRGRVLSLCHTLHWYERTAIGTLVMKNGKPVLDYKRINDFCVKNQKKRLNQLDSKELQKMIYIFEQVQKDYLNKI